MSICRTMKGALAALIAVLCVLEAGHAQEVLPPIPGTDADNWSAVGRLNVRGYRSRNMCSATLIAPDLVLTAAHCLWRGDARPHPVQDMVFVAGWNRGQAIAVAQVASVEAHPEAKAPVRSPPHDIAIVHLATPIANVRPLPVRTSDAGSAPWAMIGYQARRPHLVGGRFDCGGTRMAPHLLSLSCTTERGSSGGPVLARDENGEWRVIGVISAGNTRQTFVPVFGAWLEEQLRE